MEQNLSELIFQLQKNMREGEDLIRKIGLLQTVRNSVIMPEMITIPLPTGRAYLPLEDNKPPVELSKPYEIGKYPVTQELWESVMHSNPSRFKGSNLPVENVTWDEAVSFCENLSDSLHLKGEFRFRLPTEWEWEWAASGGSDKDFEVTDRTGWYVDNSKGRTHPVGEKDPNNFGLYDTLGNVCEWTASGYDLQGGLRVIRGGGWFIDPGDARVAFRFRDMPGGRDSFLGFRLARTITA
jgi:sulfatase modifying factor 1